MASKVSVKTTFEPAKTIEPLSTGGDVSLDGSGRLLATCIEEDALVINVDSGERVVRIESDGEPITSLALSPSASHLVVCSRSLAMRIYSLRGEESRLQRSLKPHSTPVVTSTIDGTGTLLATGGADGTVKVWDIKGGFATHTFQGHGGVISALCFFHATSIKSGSAKTKARNGGTHDRDAVPGFFLASGGEDGKIRIWNLQTRKSVASLESHVSVVKSLAFSEEQQTLLSASRDRTIILWDARSWQSRKVIPVLEVVEAAGFCQNNSYCYSGGEGGTLRLWSTSAGKEVTREQADGTEGDAIVYIQRGPTFLLSAHLDQTIKLHDMSVLENVVPAKPIAPLPITKRISGSHDEVIDLALIGPDRSLLALATNTENIRIVSISDSTATSSTHFGADVALLTGHSEIAICIDVDWSGHWLATGAKDNTARIWRLDPSTSSYTCFATFAGHTESLGAIALPRTPPSPQAASDPLNYPPAFLLTGSQDRTVKRWDTSGLKVSSTTPLHSVTKSLYTRVAHDKDINAVDVSPTSPLFASASQDRTIKIWDLESGSVTGILRGHRRGVWSIRFAPKDTPAINTESGGSSSKGLLISGSGDRTVKLWSLNTYSCILTFEGHSNSVLKVLWILPTPDVSDKGDGTVSGYRIPQKIHPIIASASSDTLIKLWSPYSSSTHANPTISLSDSHLLATLDNHTDRVWALATPTTISPCSSSESTASLHSGPTTLKLIQSRFPLISGSADSTLTFWADTTAVTLAKATSAANARIEQDQELQNHMRARNYREVITLALQLNHPGRLLTMLEDVVSAGNTGSRATEDKTGKSNRDSSERESADCKSSITGSEQVDDVLSHLAHSQLYSLLCRLRDWNTNARTAPVAQRILHLILKSYPIDTFIRMEKNINHASKVTSSDQEPTEGEVEMLPMGGKRAKTPSVKDVLRALEVYTERHLRRTEDLMDESYLLEYTLGCMDEIVGGPAAVVDDVDTIMDGGHLGGSGDLHVSRNGGQTVMQTQDMDLDH